VQYHIRRDVLLETAGHESPAGVRASEEVVRAAGPVVFAAIGDVVDGTVDGEQDRLVGVGAVVGFEILVGILLWPPLSKVLASVKRESCGSLKCVETYNPSLDDRRSCP
jgi:hypothetical protein